MALIPAQPTDDDEKRPASVRGGHQRRRSTATSRSTLLP